MSPAAKLYSVGLIGMAMLFRLDAKAPAQQSAVRQAGNAVDSSPTDGPEKVVIVREALRLTEPDKYQIALYLEPIRAVDLAAPVDGVIRTVHVEPGDALAQQAEAVRLDNTEQELLLKRAEANFRAAQIELRRARGAQDADLVELAEAKAEAAKADAELARYRLERTGVRAPFAARVFRVTAVAGQVVQAGEALMALGDTSRLKVEIPFDRKAAVEGQQIEIGVQDRTVKATVEHVLPLAERFAPLREIVNSIASAVVVVDNSSDLFKVGETVHVPLIPRHSLAEVPTNALSNTPEGERKVQVVRDNVVRDVRVQLLGQVGSERINVSGPFAEADELIVSTSRELADGTQVRPTAVAAAGQGEGDPMERGSPRAGPGF